MTNFPDLDSLEHLLAERKEDTAKANLLGSLSWYYSFNQAEKALFYGQKGVQLSQKIGYKQGVAYCTQSLSFSLWALGNYNTSLQYALNALHLYEELKNYERIAYTYFILANIYREIGDYKRALTEVRKGLKIYDEIDISNRIGYAITGSIYELQNQLDSAQLYVQKARELDVKDNSGKWGWLPYLLGKIQVKRKHYNLALAYYGKALPLVIENNSPKDIVDIYNSLATLYNETGKVDSCIFYASEVLQKWTYISYQKGILIAANTLAQAYKATNQRDSTIKYLELSMALNNKMFNQENERDIQNLAFNEQLRQDEIAREHQQYRNKLKLYGSLTVGIVILVIIALLLARREVVRRERLKANLKIKQVESDKLKELDTLKSHFFTNISHEFRTPLSLIQGTVEKLEKEDSHSSRQPDYERIDHNTNRLLELINQLLDLSKLEAGKLDLHPEPGELHNFLTVVAASFASLFESKHIIYQYQLPQQPLYLNFDRDKVEKILTNLLSNAFKFTPSGGRVFLSVLVKEKKTTTCQLEIILQDTGIGIPAEQLPRIFDLFHQVDTSATRSYEGTGVGLALVKELVELHGGKITVESLEGLGTTFSLLLPLQVATTPESQTVEPVSEIASHQASYFQKEVRQNPSSERQSPAATSMGVLVIEDNAELRHFISEQLAEHYKVFQAANGTQGYEQALETIPELIISDVMMPQMDGLTLCSKLKTDERTSHIPVILLTAKADMDSKLQGLETGADDYLTKPFKMEELQLRIHNLLESRRKLRERFSRQVTINPKEITVTSTDERFLQKALFIMEANMANADFDVEAFSKEIGMSRSQLHRKLTALSGLSVNEFIKSLRLKRAASLLSQQQGNVSEIAFSVGFSSLNYFTKCFRDFYGQTPTEYARHHVSTEISGE